MSGNFTCTYEAGLFPRIFVASEIELRAEHDIHACLPQYDMFYVIIIMVVTRPHKRILAPNLRLRVPRCREGTQSRSHLLTAYSSSSSITKSLARFTFFLASP
jgi:hypothetical protein